MNDIIGLPVNHITYVCNDLGIPVFGDDGSSIHIQSFLDALAKSGIDATILYQFGGKDNDIISRNNSWERIDQFPFQRTSISQFLAFSDLVKNVGLYRTLQRAVDPECNLIHERYSLHSIAGLSYCKRNQIPYVLEINSPLVYEKKLTGTLTIESTAKRAEEYLLSNATEVVVVSEALKEYYSNVIDEQQIHVVPNGVDTDRFDPSQHRASSSSNFTVGFVGSFKKWHGIESIVQAATQLEDLNNELRFVLIGDGPLLEQCRQKISGTELASMFEFRGSVEHDTIPEHINEFDVGLAPYPDLDFFYYSPIKVFEYMSMGVPPIASSIGQLSKVISDREDGYLMRPGDTDHLAELIRSTYEHRTRDPHNFERIGENARKKAIRSYSWKRNVERIVEVYQKACLRH